MSHCLWNITDKFDGNCEMKIKIESQKIIKAVKKLDGIEIVLENLDDAKEAFNLILLRTGLLEKHKDAELKDVRVTSSQKYETTAVDYKMIFLLEFIFEDNISVDTKVAVIKELQGFFNQVWENSIVLALSKRDTNLPAFVSLTRYCRQVNAEYVG